jgi:alpha-1,6-mannosyltransferase
MPKLHAHCEGFSSASDSGSVPGILAIGILSALLYWLHYRAQMGFLVNGLKLPFNDLSFAEFPDRSRLFSDCVVYYSSLLGLFGLYVLILRLCKSGKIRTGPPAWLALCLPVLFNLGFLLERPALSIDLFSYLGHGLIINAGGGNPYLEPVKQLNATAFGPELSAYAWRPVHGVTPYGPVWTTLEGLAVRWTGVLVPRSSF